MTRDLPVSPTPGEPLRAEDVGLLVKGDQLRVIEADTFYTKRGFPNGSNVTFDAIDEDENGQWIVVQELPGSGAYPRRFEFVSRPDRLVSAEPDRAEGGEGAEVAAVAGINPAHLASNETAQEWLNHKLAELHQQGSITHWAVGDDALAALSSSPSQEQAGAVEIARIIWERFAPESDIDPANAQRGEYRQTADQIIAALSTSAKETGQ